MCCAALAWRCRRGRERGRKRLEPNHAAPDGPLASRPAPAHWRALLALVRRLPQAGLSRAFGRVADTPLPVPLRGPVIGAFARLVGADLSEAERPVTEYPTVNAFFVRRLRRGVRRWPLDPRLAGSPVDGLAGEAGVVSRGRALQAKGRWYMVSELLGDAAEADRFDGGSFLTLYLSPRHYHRIHAPMDGEVARARHVPGSLLPVNRAAVAEIEGLFVRNERLICYLDGPLGRMAVVAIGAYNVGRISAAFDPGLVTNQPGLTTPETRDYSPPIGVSQGDDLMAFHLGSTVVVVLEPGRAEPCLEPSATGEVRLGQPLARQTA
jgi:phosphatidylserine decarboxylase